MPVPMCRLEPSNRVWSSSELMMESMILAVRHVGPVGGASRDLLR